MTRVEYRAKYKASAVASWAAIAAKAAPGTPPHELLTAEKLFSFFSRVAVGDGCWEWSGGHNRDGYGVWTVFGLFSWRVHRLMLELLRGCVPGGMQLDHLCRNRGCCNPDHLEAVTPRENTLRSNAITAKNSRKTHCKYGHKLPAPRVWASGKLERRCEPCDSRRGAEAYRRRLSKQ